MRSPRTTREKDKLSTTPSACCRQRSKKQMTHHPTQRTGHAEEVSTEQKRRCEANGKPATPAAHQDRVPTYSKEHTAADAPAAHIHPTRSDVCPRRRKHDRTVSKTRTRTVPVELGRQQRSRQLLQKPAPGPPRTSSNATTAARSIQRASQPPRERQRARTARKKVTQTNTKTRHTKNKTGNQGGCHRAGGMSTRTDTPPSCEGSAQTSSAASGCAAG